MNLTRFGTWITGLAFAVFLGWYLTTQVVGRTHGYFTADLPPHWDHSSWWMLAHIVGGMTVLAIGPIQFFPPFRNRFIRVHRTLGKIFIVMSLLSIAALLARILTVTFCVACKPSLYMVTGLWLFFLVAAYLSIRAGDVLTHMAHMMRGYVCASYFLLARYFIPTFEGIFAPMPEEYRLLVTDFLCWLVPLFALEIGLFVWRYSRIRKRELLPETI